MTTAQQIKALKEERAGKVSSLDALAAFLVTRALTADEETQEGTLKTDITGLTKRIKGLEELEERNRETATPAYPGAGSEKGDGDQGEKTERAKMVGKFSFKRMFNYKGIKDGVEAELDKEERKTMLESGVNDINSTSFMVPSDVFTRLKKQEPARRDMTATGTTSVTGDQGGISIQTNIQGMVDVFLPEMALGKVPIMRMNNLRGNVKFPQAQTFPSAGWNTENGTATEKSPTMLSLSLSPKRLAAYIQLSNQLLIQSEENIQAYANRFLISAAAIEFEKACLKGGGANEPSGILSSTSNYLPVYAGDAVNNAANAQGSRMVWADWVKLVSTPKSNNSPDGQAFITSPAIKGRAQITPRQSGGVEGNFILRDWNSGINGYPVLGTTNLPDTFTKGTSSALSAVIFGDWSNFVAASWGGMEIGVDPYVNMKEGMVNIVLGAYLDCGVLNPNAFAAVKDAQSY